MPQSFATGRVTGLNGQRVQGPEAAFGKPEKSAAPEPTKGDDNCEEQDTDPDERGHHFPGGSHRKRPAPSALASRGRCCSAGVRREPARPAARGSRGRAHDNGAESDAWYH